MKQKYTKKSFDLRFLRKNLDFNICFVYLTRKNDFMLKIKLIQIKKTQGYEKNPENSFRPVLYNGRISGIEYFCKQANNNPIYPDRESERLLGS